MLVGTETSDDAGVFRLRSDLAIVNTVDFFTPLVDDPYAFGQIAAANALSDVYAMGGRPMTALNIVGFPDGRLPASVLTSILRGGAERVERAGAFVVGGHTVVDPELKYGLAITGVVHPDRLVRNGGARAGDELVLTKPLGTGIVATGIKRGATSRQETEIATATMAALNAEAGKLLHRCQAHACTDITGFGLAGHAAEMAAASERVRLEFDADAIALLPGTARLAESGFVTGGSKRNRQFLAHKLSLGEIPLAISEAVVDPQTSGGLLVSLAAERAAEYVALLKQQGVVAGVVGRVVERAQRSRVLVRFV